MKVDVGRLTLAIQFVLIAKLNKLANFFKIRDEYEIKLGGSKRETYLALAALHLIQLSSSAMCEDILVFEKFKWS